MPYSTRPATRQHTFNALVEDKPGVLNRITSLLRRRNFNIVSLNVGRTHEPGVSAMTVVVEADDDTARIVQAHLYKLVNVIRVDDITARARISRDLALIKVAACAETRARIVQIAELFRARVVDVATATLVIEITGTQDKIDGLLAMLRPFGVREMIQTGAIAMTRGG